MRETRGAVLAAAAATLLLIAAEYLFFRLQYGLFVTYVLDLLHIGSFLAGGVVLTLILVGLVQPFLLFLAVAAAPRRRRLLYLLALALVIALQHGYHRALGRFATLADYRVLRSVDSKTMVEAVLTYSAPSAALPLLVIGAVLLVPRDGRGIDARARRGFEAAALACGLALSVVYALGGQRVPAPSVSAFLQVASAAAVHEFRAGEVQRESPPSFDHRAPEGNVVLIVDESVRGDHLSVNGYHRETTPRLERWQRAGWLRTWGASVSTTTNSVDSNRALLVGYFDEPEGEELWRRPTLFSYAKAAGYTTWYLDAWSTGTWIADEADLGDVDHRWQRSADAEVADHDLDAALGRELARILAGSTGNFVWVNKRGMHWPYFATFPPTDEIWQPSLRSLDQGLEHAEAIANAYDNGIRYNFDAFFGELEVVVPELLSGTTILYTADHGQTLSEGGELRTHMGDTPAEATVPLLLIADPSVTVDTDFLASHRNIHPTVLQLLGIPRSLWPEDAALSLLEARAEDSEPRSFYWLWGFRGSLVSAYRQIPFDR